MSEYHRSVLVREVLELLPTRRGGTYVDATFGGGGHTEAILQADPECKVIACDWDENALRLNGDQLVEKYGNRLKLVWSNFARIQHQLKKCGILQVDGILADFGTSQYQIKQQPGFSFDVPSPLDMRMSKGHFYATAADIVNRYSEKDLIALLYEYGEERNAPRIVREIIASRPITMSTQLAEIIARVVPRGESRIHPATKTFQALRIVVNKELENIHALLLQAGRVIRPGGRLVCISFHSLEDRMVKHYFMDHRHEWEVITKHIVTASEEELLNNSSSRSAKLRCAQRR